MPIQSLARAVGNIILDTREKVWSTYLEEVLLIIEGLFLLVTELGQ